MMKRHKNIPLVEYEKGEEFLNTLTHAAGLVLCGLIAAHCLVPAVRAADTMRAVCASLYLAGTALTFLISTAYHAAKPGAGKRTLRLADHCAIFFAVAGTATGTVPAVIDTVGLAPAVAMIVCAWGGAVAGLVCALADFEKTKAVRMILYIATAAVCAVCGGGAFKVLPKGAFRALLLGGALLLTGAALMGLGKKRRYFHCLFHVFIDAGLTVYYIAIAAYCYSQQPVT